MLKTITKTRAEGGWGLGLPRSGVLWHALTREWDEFQKSASCWLGTDFRRRVKVAVQLRTLAWWQSSRQRKNNNIISPDQSPLLTPHNQCRLPCNLKKQPHWAVRQYMTPYYDISLSFCFYNYVRIAVVFAKNMTMWRFPLTIPYLFGLLCSKKLECCYSLLQSSL